MHKPFTSALLLGAGLLCAPGISLASGGVPQGPDLTNRSPEEVATQNYNRALHYRNKAWKLEEKAGGQPGSQAAKLDGKVQAQFKKMIKALETAVKKNPRYYEAFSSLGYAHRRTGDYEAALTAYDRSLELNPNYPEAIEYRAEAYLALNRPSDARDAYLRLKLLSPKKADELLQAFGTWLEARRQNPAGLEASELDQLAEWVAGQTKMASINVKAATGAQDGSW